ncbi:MAG: Asp23/Gls24 family envelope stress response protein [Bacillaceae bacterium]|nr:Asp23/Gls24 family envelope stress response protein [Bacillaceae bacterium]
MAAVLEQPFGTLEIDPHVLAIIAGKTALETKGIIGMSGGLVEDLSEKWGFKHGEKGIKVNTDQYRVSFELKVTVQYGEAIHHVCREMQQHIRTTIEDMTGLEVDYVNVEVEGVRTILEDEDTEPVKKIG